MPAADAFGRTVGIFGAGKCSEYAAILPYAVDPEYILCYNVEV